MEELSLGDRELDVMTVLWELGDGTVTEVREKLPADLAYTTVLTILRKLEAKGLVRHKVEGKAHRYIPRVAQKNARRTVLGRLIDKLFDGSPEQLLAHLVDDHNLTPAQVKRMREQLSGAAKKGGDR
jgi:BlaI family transcriptional regulator, penicillinase repressor